MDEYLLSLKIEEIATNTHFVSSLNSNPFKNMSIFLCLKKYVFCALCSISIVCSVFAQTPSRTTSKPSSATPSAPPIAKPDALPTTTTPSNVAAPRRPSVNPNDRTITLQEAVTLVLQNNTNLQKAQQQVLLQDLNIEQALQNYLPSASASANYGQNAGLSFDTRSGSLSSRSSSSFNTGVGFNFPIFESGHLNRISPELNQNAPAVKQARLEKEVSVLSVERAKEQLVLSVVTGYLEVLRADEQIGVQEENLVAQKQQLERIRQFVRAGTRAAVDELQQQANVAQTELQLLNGKRAFELAKTRLIQTLQLDPLQSYNFVAPSIANMDLNREVYHVNDMIRAALANRTDIKVQQATISANEMAIKLTRLARFPNIGFNAGMNTGYSSLAPNNFVKQLQDGWGANWGIGLNFTIFDKGQIRRQVQQAQIRKEGAQLDLTALEQSIAVEVRQSYLDYISAGKELDVSETQLNYTKQALDAEQNRYNLGASTLTELTQARTNYVNAQSQRLQAQYNLAFQKQLILYYLGQLKPEQVGKK